MRKLRLDSCIVSLDIIGLIITADANKSGETGFRLSPEETYNLFSFLYQHRSELFKMSHQQPQVENEPNIVLQEHSGEPNQQSDLIDWERHLSN